MTLVTVEQYDGHILAAVSHPHGSAFRNRDRGRQHSETVIRYDNGEGQKEEGMPFENKKGLMHAPPHAGRIVLMILINLKLLSVVAAQTQIESQDFSLVILSQKTTPP